MRSTPPEKHILRFRLDVDTADTAAWAPYEAAAKHLADDPQVLRLVDELERVTRIKPTPFVVLENSSGTGKTQMAFNLRETEVFHILCHSPGDADQPVYRAFNASFRWCAAKDKDVLKQGSIRELEDTPRLYLYGFIAAALDGRTEFSVPARRIDVSKAIARRRERTSMPTVFFLDEFPRIRYREDRSREETSHDAECVSLLLLARRVQLNERNRTHSFSGS
ncbi:hypothetical protein Poli38472_010938 [Pythium oligandrum]|uniref:Uncharacterized protein n=1 Tax=Pythium oligandrum TaxID=41045 RepID=A0A8K1FFP2_PYTOL|nr:hypothetical protein Poli38472_010938 [Pythium oligandrum]|eukprot:TMW61875.1 hypothetical protein Poli38472_010938 [Pythium oligandrum]